jgi:hypothetical protein
MIYLKHFKGESPQPPDPLDDLPQVRTISIPGTTKEPPPGSTVVVYGVYRVQEKGSEPVAADSFASTEGSPEERAYGTTVVRLAFKEAPSLECIEEVRQKLEANLNLLKDRSHYSWFLQLVEEAMTTDIYYGFNLQGYSVRVPN